MPAVLVPSSGGSADVPGAGRPAREFEWGETGAAAVVPTNFLVAVARGVAA